MMTTAFFFLVGLSLIMIIYRFSSQIWLVLVAEVLLMFVFTVAVSDLLGFGPIHDRSWTSGAWVNFGMAAGFVAVHQLLFRKSVST